jgi:hypothetical protein
MAPNGHGDVTSSVSGRCGPGACFRHRSSSLLPDCHQHCFADPHHGFRREDNPRPLRRRGSSPPSQLSPERWTPRRSDVTRRTRLTVSAALLGPLCAEKARTERWTVSRSVLPSPPACATRSFTRSWICIPRSCSRPYRFVGLSLCIHSLHSRAAVQGLLLCAAERPLTDASRVQAAAHPPALVTPCRRVLQSVDMSEMRRKCDIETLATHAPRQLSRARAHTRSRARRFWRARAGRPRSSAAARPGAGRARPYRARAPRAARPLWPARTRPRR